LHNAELKQVNHVEILTMIDWVVSLPIFILKAVLLLLFFF